MPTIDLSSYHQNSGTTSDGAKFNNLIDAVQTAVNGLDTNNLTAGAGIKGSQLATGVNGPPGTELAYAEKTSNTTTTQTVSASSVDTIATLAAVTFDGATKAKVEAFVPEVFNSVATNYNNLLLFEDGTFRAIIGRVQGSGTSQGTSAAASFEFTPASGSRTYSLRTSVQGGTGTFGGGGGTAGAIVPAYIKIVKA